MRAPTLRQIRVLPVLPLIPFIGAQVGHSNPAITYAAYARLFNAAGQSEKGLAAMVAARGVQS